MKIKDDYKRIRTIIHSCRGNVKFAPACLNLVRNFRQNNNKYFGNIFADKLYKSMELQFG